jgi:hypothetical protein
MFVWRLHTLPAALLAFAPAVRAHPAPPPDPPAHDKSRDHLFHPTPVEFLRDLETDRPDLTESPITVDAGHFQIEADLFNYAVSDHDGRRQEDLAAPVLNLKAGLLHHVDLQVILSPYVRTRIEDRATSPATVTTASGFGDLQVRTKFNLWGNDGGRTAFAFLPFIQFPTGESEVTSGAVEGGMIFPFALELPAGFGAGMQWGVDFVRNPAGSGYHTDFVQSLAIGRDLTGPLSAYLEFFSVVSTESGSDWLGSFDLGFNYLVNPNLKLDAGLNIGVTRSAPDWNPFLGLTWRF